MDNNQSVPQAVVAQPTLPPSSPIQPPVSSQAGSLYKAGLVRRYIALLIDSLLFLPIYLIMPIFAAFLASIFRDSNNIALLVLLPVFYFLPSLLFVLYNIFFNWKYGATLGKKWLKVKVISTTGQPLTLGQVTLRETIGRFLSGLIFSLGYVWAIWDKNRQTWHDKLGKTLVVTTVPNNGKNPWWYYLILVLPIISILAILAAIVVLAINPLGTVRKGQDAARLSDLTNLQVAIQIAQAQDPSLNLCIGTVAPCEGISESSGLANRNINGTGWVKIDLSKVQSQINLPSLPIDPSNTSIYYYRYCSDSKEWEIDARLDSAQNRSKMENDGGDDDQLYELGTNLGLCPQR